MPIDQRAIEVTGDEVPRPLATSLLGDAAEEFGMRTNPFRRELLIHCYRMLGSIDDAEDAVQDTLAAAWRGRSTFQQSISLRAWLYRIATNSCLDAIERRKRTQRVEGRDGVGPIPDDVLGDASTEPAARYDAHESVSRAGGTRSGNPVCLLLPPIGTAA